MSVLRSRVRLRYRSYLPHGVMDEQSCTSFIKSLPLCIQRAIATENETFVVPEQYQDKEVYKLLLELTKDLESNPTDIS